MAIYNVAYQREQAEKAKYKGRGKYKRTLDKYIIDAFSRKEHQKLESAIAFGYRAQLQERSSIHSRLRSGYRIEVFNATKGKRIK